MAKANHRHCEPFACLAGAQDKLREATQGITRDALGCFVASLLAMTKRREE